MSFAPRSKPVPRCEYYHLLEGLRVGEIVQESSARIVARKGDKDDARSAVGNAEFSIVKVAAAMSGGISLVEAIDSVHQNVYEYGAAVLDPDNRDIRTDLVE